ncbi:hypothetical protein PMZ80_005102 [Knufia obscura]|uniref:Uncharacterized protein n=1 Tax=Knufia obscura TaxID=1635080 RepID=A0ABR0RPK0_9EURO|nr:hypothetical protein PMZ80_005102 [Knufia obscura]
MEVIAKKPIAEQIQILKVNISRGDSSIEHLLIGRQDIHEQMIATTKVKEHLQSDTRIQVATASSSNATKTELDREVTETFESVSRTRSEHTGVVLARIKRLETLQEREKEFDDLEKHCKKLTEEVAEAKRFIRKHFDATNDVEDEGDTLFLCSQARDTKINKKRRLDKLAEKADEVAALCKKLKTQEDKSSIYFE